MSITTPRKITIDDEVVVWDGPEDNSILKVVEITDGNVIVADGPDTFDYPVDSLTYSDRYELWQVGA